MENYRIQRIKGDIVETICKNHFAAMGFQVENAGVEHFATQFANRPGHQRGKMGGTNVNKIQNYIGRLPDLLVGHEKHNHHFAEGKISGRPGDTRFCERTVVGLPQADLRPRIQ